MNNDLSDFQWMSTVSTLVFSDISPSDMVFWYEELGPIRRCAVEIFSLTNVCSSTLRWPAVFTFRLWARQYLPGWVWAVFTVQLQELMSVSISCLLSTEETALLIVWRTYSQIFYGLIFPAKVSLGRLNSLSNVIKDAENVSAPLQTAASFLHLTALFAFPRVSALLRNKKRMKKRSFSFQIHLAFIHISYLLTSQLRPLDIHSTTFLNGHFLPILTDENWRQDHHHHK